MFSLIWRTPFNCFAYRVTVKPLRDEHDMDFSVKSKSTLCFDNLLVLHYHHGSYDTVRVVRERQRAQLSLSLWMIAYTSC